MARQGRAQLKVMVSSTVCDLPDHRQGVLDACLRQGMFPMMMNACRPSTPMRSEPRWIWSTRTIIWASSPSVMAMFPRDTTPCRRNGAQPRGAVARCGDWPLTCAKHASKLRT